MIGIVTEKPSAKKNFMVAFKGDRGRIDGQDFIIVNLIGHLYQFKNVEDQVPKEKHNFYKRWSMNNLPWELNDFKWVKQKSYSDNKIYKELKEILSKCDEIVIATDKDPSGEGALLGGEVLLELGLTKGKKITRMEFIDESPSVLLEAFEKRRYIPDITKDPEYLKALFRSQWDFLSIQYTRIATILSPQKAVIPEGRLKTYMVHCVGDQEKLVNDYIKTEEFQNIFIDENKVIYTDPKEPKYKNKADVPQKYNPSDVIMDSRELKQTPPPSLMDLSKLSSLLSRSGYKPKQVLKTYQDMYNAHYLSYPRTADKNITPNQFYELLPFVNKIADVVGVDKSILTHRKPRPTHVQPKGDHGANRPGTRVPNSINEIENVYGHLGVKIYTILSKSFLSMLAENYEYEQQKGHIKDYPTFKGTSNVPKSMGWKLILSSFEDKSNDDNSTLGLGKKGKPSIKTIVSPKPTTPSMGWLMDLMRKESVGTGATRTSTFGDISSSSSKNALIEMNRSQIKLTEYGRISYNLTRGTKIAEKTLTNEVFQVVNKIGDGDNSVTLKTLNDISNHINNDIKIMSENSKNIYNGITSAQTPPAEKHKFTKENGEELSFKTEWNGYKFNENEIIKLKNNEEIIIGPFQGKKGQYLAQGHLGWNEFKAQGNKKVKFFGFNVTKFLPYTK